MIKPMHGCNSLGRFTMIRLARPFHVLGQGSAGAGFRGLSRVGLQRVEGSRLGVWGRDDTPSPVSDCVLELGGSAGEQLWHVYDRQILALPFMSENF